MQVWGGGKKKKTNWHSVFSPSGNIYGSGGENSCLVVLMQHYNSTGHQPGWSKTTHSACNPTFKQQLLQQPHAQVTDPYFFTSRRTVDSEMIHREKDLFSSVAFFGKKKDQTKDLWFFFFSHSENLIWWYSVCSAVRMRYPQHASWGSLH